MRKELISKFGRVSSAVKPAVLWYCYHDLTGDSSGSETSSQKELDDRVKRMIEMEDSGIMADLRHMNSGAQSKYDHFWEECSKFLEQQVGTAVDNRRHREVTHIATAISVWDLRSDCGKALLAFNASLDVSIKKSQVGRYPRLQSFIQHCCRQRHYFFMTSGKPDCDICESVRLPDGVFQQLHHLPPALMDISYLSMIYPQRNTDHPLKQRRQ